ncbi:MAG: hypothetical protein ACK4S0_06365 [Sediminibacterium sp.]
MKKENDRTVLGKQSKDPRYDMEIVNPLQGCCCSNNSSSKQ